MIRIREQAGTGIGVSPLGVIFPLLRRDDSLRGLLADFRLQLVRATPLKQPLRLSWLYGIGRFLLEDPGDFVDEPGPFAVARDIELRVHDADDALVFDSRDASWTRSTSFGERLVVHEWSDGESALCRLTQHSAFPDDETAWTPAAHIEPDDGRLDPRCCEVAPPRVDRVIVGGSAIRGPVLLTSGYNIGFARSGRRLTMTATPGGGLGRRPSCEEPAPVIKRINGVAGDANGDLRISALGCHWLREPTTLDDDDRVVAVPHELRIGNVCVPCPNCDDVVATYQGLRVIAAAAATAGRSAERVRVAIADANQRWADAAACRRDRAVSAILRVRADGEFTVLAQICNASDACLTNVEARIDLEVSDPTDPGCGLIVDHVRDCASFIFDDARGWLPYETYRAGGKIAAGWGIIKPGGTARVVIRGKAPCVGPGSSVTACVESFVGPETYAYPPDIPPTCVTTAVPDACPGE